MFKNKIDVPTYSAFITQWSFGVTCWEVFTAGKIPYPAIDPATLLNLLDGGLRLEFPTNAACSAEM